MSLEIEPKRWCRAVDEAGKIEVRLDADGLAGTHILSGIEIVLLLFARAGADIRVSLNRGPESTTPLRTVDMEVPGRRTVETWLFSSAT